MRAGMSPLDNFSADEIIFRNLLGTNVGNLIYAYGLFRTLTKEDVSVVPTYYKLETDADKVNEEYDAFVIPLADAFRADFMPEIRKMTTLVKKLKIPCVVTGVGLRASFEPSSELKFSFDDDVRNFIKAILEKSAMVGVRGEITADYLTQLGFREGTDHKAIGCPSMYTYGRELKLKELNLTTESRISINSSVLSQIPVFDFLNRTADSIKDHYFLPQKLEELKLIYLGSEYKHKQKCDMYPHRITDKIYSEDRVKYFLRATEWIDFLRTVDLSIGGRLHGNITALISGTPSVIIPHDARMRELTDFHALPHIWANEVNEKTDVFDLVSKIDFQKVQKKHKENFDNFVSFLNINELDNIYKEDINNKVAPLDSQIHNDNKNEVCVNSVVNCNVEEVANRWTKYNERVKRHLSSVQSEVKTLKESNKKLEKVKKTLKNQLDSKIAEENKAKKFTLFGKTYTVRIKKNPNKKNKE